MCFENSKEKKRTYSEFAERDKYKDVRWLVRNSVHHRLVECLNKIRLFIYMCFCVRCFTDFSAAFKLLECEIRGVC
jgi:hypothetical protein